MTTFLVAMLAIICIFGISRYYGNANLASNLLLVLAFSFFVGLSFNYRRNKITKKEEVKIESVATINSSSMQLCAALETDTCSLPRIAGQKNKLVVNPFNNKNLFVVHNVMHLPSPTESPPIPDSS
jgi:hypothetical protein